MRREAAETDQQAREEPAAAPLLTRVAAPEHLMALQRTAGNQAVARMLQRAAAATAEPAAEALLEARVEEDVEKIVALLRQQVLWAGEEAEIAAIVERYADDDLMASARAGEPLGTPGLDELILKLKLRAFTRATARSGFMDTTVNAWDTLWYELSDDRLERFKRAVAKSREHGARLGPDGANSENFWETMGEQEAIGLLGAAKGLSAGLAGLLDLGGWAMTKQANMVLDPVGQLIGTDIKLDAPNLAQEVGEGFDFMGDALFGKEQFSQGESLLLGMNAAQIGNLGGGIIWSLTMAGAGGQAQAGSQAKALLTALDVLGKIKSVEDTATSMLVYLEAKRKQGPITWDALRDDPLFWLECTKLASAIASAVALGVTDEAGASSTLKKVLETASPYLKGGQIAAKVARIVQILNDPSKPPEAKEREAGQIVGELIAEAFDLLAGKAAELDAEEAKAAQAAKAASEDRKRAAGRAIADALAAPDPFAAAASASASDTIPLDPGRAPDDQSEMPHMRFGEVDLDPVPEGAAPLEIVDLRPEPKSAESRTELHESLDATMRALDELQPVDQPGPQAEVIEVKAGGPVVRDAPEVPEAVVSPERLRETFGMPEENQAKFAEIAAKHGVEIDVRPTTADAPDLLAAGAVPKVEDLKSKTISDVDTYIGASPDDVGKVGFFKPEPPRRPAGMTDLEWAIEQPKAVERFKQRDAEYWDNARKMTELQSRPENQDGTHGANQIEVGPGGVVGNVTQQGAQVVTSPFTGDHDVYDIRNADGTPVSPEKYEAIVAEMKAANMGVAHGAHKMWKPQGPAEQAIYDKIVDAHASGQELLIRFRPGQPPATTTAND